MTKKELIKALEPFEDDAKVWAMTGNCASSEIIEVSTLGASDIMLDTAFSDQEAGIEVVCGLIRKKGAPET